MKKQFKGAITFADVLELIRAEFGLHILNILNCWALLFLVLFQALYPTQCSVYLYLPPGNILFPLSQFNALTPVSSVSHSPKVSVCLPLITEGCQDRMDWVGPERGEVVEEERTWQWRLMAE